MNVTRELKLALIVGFSLVLVVTILVSDYFSKARRVSLATPAGDTQVSMKAAPEWKPAPPEQLTPTNPEQGGMTAAVPPPVGGSEPVIIRQGSGWNDGGSSIVGGVDGVLNKTPDQPLIRTTVEPDLSVNPQGTIVPDPTRPDVNKPTTTVTPVPTLVSPAPVGPTAPSTNEKMHTVASGDTMYVICKKYYGSTKYWKELAAFNSATLKNPAALKLGQKLRIPSVEMLGGTKPGDVSGVASSEPKLESKPQAKPSTKPSTPANGKTYIVQKGDTPGAIAQKTLGTSRKADELMKFNKIEDDAALKIGMVLNIPN
ncbi:MAG: LysM peptidoglycan-binding domain-containing protein [Planctomycetes bacterium]|nr:LysM peptidoglycan-binding domain-containing protein [Planctomycetota bacterium]